MSTESPATTDSLLQFNIGPLRLDVAKERILISRVDKQVPQQLVVRPHETHECIELAIMSSDDGSTSERVIARTQLLNLNKSLDFIVAPMREAVVKKRPITVEELEREDYSILLIEEEYWQTLLARVTGQDGIPDFSPARMEELAPELLEKVGDSLYKPGLLNVLVEYDDTSQPLLAVADFENPSKMLWVRWDPAAKAWMAFRFIPDSIPLLDVQKMGELMSAQAKRAPRFIYFLHEFVQELQLEEWIDFVQLSSVHKQILAALDGFGSFQALAYDYHMNIYETEHHHNLNKLSTQIAVSNLPQSPTVERLNDVHRGQTDFALRTLVERTEIVLGRFKRHLTEILAKGTDQTLHKKVASLSPGNPEQCLDAFKLVGVSANLIQEIKDAIRIPTQLRHMWTHRGRRIDAKFFSLIGRNGQSPVKERIFGRDVELREGERFVAIDDDVPWFSIVVTVLIDKLYNQLVAIYP